jgi:hypothetical protein
MTQDNPNNNIESNPNTGNPREAEPGKGAGGQQWGVQMAQNPNVNDPKAVIPSNADVEQNVQQLKDFSEQEAGTTPTTHGYVIDEAGNIDNFAVEPPMRVEGE